MRGSVVRVQKEETKRTAREMAQYLVKQQEPDFVNHGLRRWEEGRAKWRRGTRGMRRPAPPVVDDEVIYDTIFSKPMGWLLPHPVPLAHMVELLDDEWSD